MRIENKVIEDMVEGCLALDEWTTAQVTSRIAHGDTQIFELNVFRLVGEDRQITVSIQIKEQEQI